jgi:hypothetical protein
LDAIREYAHTADAIARRIAATLSDGCTASTVAESQ